MDQALLINTNYNGVASNQINLTLDFNQNDLMGDLNYDGLVNVIDAILVINMALENEYDSLADLNADQEVNIFDVVLIINIILNN